MNFIINPSSYLSFVLYITSSVNMGLKSFPSFPKVNILFLSSIGLAYSIILAHLNKLEMHFCGSASCKGIWNLCICWMVYWNDYLFMLCIFKKLNLKLCDYFYLHLWNFMNLLPIYRAAITMSYCLVLMSYLEGLNDYKLDPYWCCILEYTVINFARKSKLCIVRTMRYGASTCENFVCKKIACITEGTMIGTIRCF